MGKLSGSRELLIALDSMKYPNTGLFHFGKSLGKAISEHKEDELPITFYMNKRYFGMFGWKGIGYLATRELYKLFFPYRYAVYHFTDQYARLPLTRVKGRKILTIHDLNQLHEPGRSKGKIEKYLKRFRKYIHHCDVVVAISHFVAEDILRQFPEAKDKVTVIHNGADKLEVSEGYVPSYRPDGEFLFALGLVSSKKNFHVIPPLLVGNELKLIISGIIVKEYKERICAVARKHGVLDRVVFTGPVSDQDKAWYYKNCKAFIFPSLAEGFGLPVIEAMHFGKPVFLSTKTSLPEIGGTHAFYFEHFEATYMQRVFANGMNQFNELAAENMKVYAEQFSWENAAKRYLDIYCKFMVC